MKCKKCKIKMKDGIALKNTLKMGLPDFPGQTDMRGQTFSYTGPPVIINVKKCPECGHSVRNKQWN